MLYVTGERLDEASFVNLLQLSREHILANVLTSGNKPKDGVHFQRLVHEALDYVSVGTEFEGEIRETGKHGFPDLVAQNYYGIEVKMTEGDKWTSLGNSIFEGTRAEGVSRIYMYFGKFGKVHDIKYRRYEECLLDIKVTHSPRYTIDMNLAPGRSIFDKLGVSYEVLRLEKNPVRSIREYYRKLLKKGQEAWWLDDSAGRETSPVIRSYNDLSKEEKEQYIYECMILFPEVFGPSPRKFDRPGAYLLTSYGAICSNLRDIFTAGGKDRILIRKKAVIVSRIVGKLAANADRIVEMLRSVDRAQLSDCWRTDVLHGDPVSTWQSILDQYVISKDDKRTIGDILRDCTTRGRLSGVDRDKNFIGRLRQLG